MEEAETTQERLVREEAVDAVAWKVGSSPTGAIRSQSSSIEMLQGSSFISSDNNNVPSGFDLQSPGLIRGRRALYPISAPSQEAGSALSLLPPQPAGGNILFSSAQVASNNLRDDIIVEAQACESREIEIMIQQDDTTTARLDKNSWQPWFQE